MNWGVRRIYFMCIHACVQAHKKGASIFPQKKITQMKMRTSTIWFIRMSHEKKTKMKMNPTHCLNEQSHNDIITVTLKTTTFMPNIRSYCHSWSKGMQRQLLQDNKACTQIPKFQTIKKMQPWSHSSKLGLKHMLESLSKCSNDCRILCIKPFYPKN